MNKTIKKIYISSAVFGLAFLGSVGVALAANPILSTYPANPVSQTQATLNGFFTTSASSIDVRFQYGLSPIMGTFTPVQTISGPSSVFSATIPVTAGTTVYFQAVGVDNSGAGYGSTLNFTVPNYTLPTVSTYPADTITSTSAILNGFFNSNGSNTSTSFEYANNSGLIGSTTLSFTAQPGNSGAFSAPISGLLPNTTYYFRAVAKNAGGTAYATSILHFTTLPAVSAACSITSFIANPNSVTSGNSSTLSWTTSNCTSASIDNGIGNVSPASNGSISTGALFTTTHYTLTATSSNNTDQAEIWVTITGSNPVCAINSFYASPSNVNSGNSSVLYWSTTNCTSVSIDNGIGGEPLSGSTSTGAIYGNTTFTLYAYSSNGNPTSQTTVSINTYSSQSCTIDSFYASPNNINQYDSAQLYWSLSNCTSASISPSIGSVSPNSGSISTNSLSGTTTFTLSVYGNTGSPSQSVTVVQVNGNNNNCYNNCSCNNNCNNNCNYSNCNNCYNSNCNNYQGQPQAVTDSASSVGLNYATLNGHIENALGTETTYTFQYGTNPNALNYATNYSKTNAYYVTNSLRADVANLLPNTTYYFRLYANNQYGTGYGDVHSFTTGTGTQYISPVTTPSTNVVYVNNTTSTATTATASSSDLVSLKIDTSFNTVNTGDTVSFNVSYKNISAQTLKNANLSVVLPKELTFRQATSGFYNGSALAVNVGTLAPGDSGSVMIETVLGNTGASDTLVTTATLTFTKKGGAQDQAVAYAFTKVNGSSLAGLALFGSDTFLPHTFLQWLILILVILGLILLGRTVFAPKKPEPMHRAPAPAH